MADILQNKELFMIKPPLGFMKGKFLKIIYLKNYKLYPTRKGPTTTNSYNYEQGISTNSLLNYFLMLEITFLWK